MRVGRPVKYDPSALSTPSEPNQMVVRAGGAAEPSEELHLVAKELSPIVHGAVFKASI